MLSLHAKEIAQVLERVDFLVASRVLSKVVWQQLLRDQLDCWEQFLTELLILLSTLHAELDLVHEGTHDRDDQGLGGV